MAEITKQGQKEQENQKKETKGFQTAKEGEGDKGDKRESAGIKMKEAEKDGKAARRKRPRKLKKEEVGEILDLLETRYPEAGCALDFGSLYQLLVVVVLSAQTTDKSVNQISGSLFEAYPVPEALAGARQEDVEEKIRRIGLYKTKASNIIRLSRALVEEHGGRVPDTYEELVRLPGVGRKTANVVLSVGFGQQRIAVDTHVFRVANRIGLTQEKDVLKTELSLMKVLPEERWTRTHHSLIFHGRNCCRAQKPDCGVCPVSGYCRWFADLSAGR